MRVTQDVPPDPFSNADHQRMFREWLEDLAEEVEARTGAPWSDAFDAVVDVVDCTSDHLPRELVVEAASRYVAQRDDRDGVGASEMRRRVRDELEDGTPVGDYTTYSAQSISAAPPSG